MRDGNSQKGFSLIELVIYIAVFSFTLSTTVAFTVLFLRSYGDLKISNNINNSAVVSLERMVREIRSAESVDLVQSILNTDQGRLVINTTDEFGEPLELDFYLSGGSLLLGKNGVYFGMLTRDGVSVDKLLFRVSNNGVSDIVKIEMDLTNNIGEKSKTETFSVSALLR
jgi:hypothetical protein